MKAFSSSWVMVILLATTFAACDSKAAAQVPNAALFVPSEHRNVRVETGGRSVAFEIDDPFPADDFLVSLENHYHPPDWSKVDELVLFPGRRTSEFAAGWREFSERGNQVKMWITNWRRVDGAFVTYIVRYRWPEGQSVDQARVAEVQAVFSERAK